MDSDQLDNVFIGSDEALGLTNPLDLEEEPENEVVDAYITSEEEEGDFPLVEVDYESSEGEDKDANDRIRITPSGNTFRNSKEVLPAAYSIIKGLFTGPWTCWRRVPTERKDLWFDEFKIKFFWKDKYADSVKRNWRGKCSTFLRTTFSRARENKKKPTWIARTIWDDMLKFWATEDFKILSAANKSHRACLKGGWTGGSKPSQEHVLEYEDKYKKKMTQAKFMRKVYRTKGKKKKWTNTKTQLAIERFKELCKAFKETHPEGLTKEDRFRLWAEAGGVNQKGHMICQGSMKKTPNFRNPGTLPSRDMSRNVDDNQLGELRKSMEEELRRSEDMRKDTEDKIQQVLMHSKQQEARYVQMIRAQQMQIQRLAHYQQVPFLEPLQVDTSISALLNSPPNQIAQADSSFLALLNSSSPLLNSPNPPLSGSSILVDTLANNVGYRPSVPTSADQTPNGRS